MNRITIPSNASYQYYPENTTSNFNIKLSHSLNFNNKEYECGISEIIYPNQIMNIRKGLNEVAIYCILKNDPKNDRKNTPKIVFNVPPGYYNSIEEVVVIIKEEFKHAKVDRNINNKPEQIKALDLKYDSKTKRITLETKFGYGIHFGIDLCSLFGFKEDGGQLNYAGHFVNYGKRTSEFHASIRKSVNTMYVYTNIIKEQHVGGEKAPLLRIVNIGEKQLEKVQHLLRMIQYITVH